MLLMAATPFLLIGLYGLAALLIAATIRLTIRKDEYNADDYMSIVLWSLISGLLLAVAGPYGYTTSAVMLTICMAYIAWPSIDRALQADDGQIHMDGKIIIKDAEVIDI